EAEISKRGIDGVLAHRALGASHPREQKLATPGEGPELLDDLDCLGSKRHDVRSPCFARSESPLRRLDVNVVPPCLPKLARPHEQQWRELESRCSHERASVTVHCPQEDSDLHRISDAGQMLGPVLLQGTNKRIRGIVLTPAGSDRIPEDPSGKRPSTIGTLDDSPPLEFA